MYVRVLRNWRGLRAGIFADIRGQHLREGIAESALDDQASIADVPGAVKHPDVIGVDEAPEKPAKAKAK